MSSNVRSAVQRVTLANLEDDMNVYDSLPPEARALLRNAEGDYSAIEIRNFLLMGFSLTEITKALRHTDRVNHAMAMADIEREG
jgi:hypothetical protein